MAINYLYSSDADRLIHDLIQTAVSTAGGDDEVSKRITFLSGDVSDPATGPNFIEHILSLFGKLDIFVSNAGICEFKNFLECVYPQYPRILIS